MSRLSAAFAMNHLAAFSLRMHIAYFSMEIALRPDIPPIEACLEGRTGWAIGDGVASEGDAGALYDKLEHAVLPLYYQDRAGGRSPGISTAS